MNTAVKVREKTCGDCIHERACQMWAGTCGIIRNADASACVNFEALRESNAYYLGRKEALEAVLATEDEAIVVRAVKHLIERLERLEKLEGRK